MKRGREALCEEESRGRIRETWRKPTSRTAQKEDMRRRERKESMKLNAEEHSRVGEKTVYPRWKDVMWYSWRTQASIRPSASVAAVVNAIHPADLFRGDCWWKRRGPLSLDTGPSRMEDSETIIHDYRERTWRGRSGKRKEVPRATRQAREMIDPAPPGAAQRHFPTKLQ